jgi:hypothetical protein
VNQPTSFLARRLAERRDVAPIIREVYGSTAAHEIVAMLDRFTHAELGAGLERMWLFAASVGCVHGVQLSDGRRLVIKAHRTLTDPDFLNAVARVQGYLHERGFPAPEPIAGPVRFGAGLATVEGALPVGQVANGHDPEVRRALAAGLAGFVTLTRGLEEVEALGNGTMEAGAGELWPTPHSTRFDFAGTAPAGKWIDRLGRIAKATTDDHRSPPVIGHMDWRVENVCVAGAKIVAVYDWDSVRLIPEPVLLGSVANTFTTNWSTSDENWVQFPTLAEVEAFIAEYQAARQQPFTEAELRVCRAAVVYAMGYTARCQLSDRLTAYGSRPVDLSDTPPIPADGAEAFLARHASELLGVDVGPLPRPSPLPLR